VVIAWFLSQQSWEKKVPEVHWPTIAVREKAKHEVNYTRALVVSSHPFQEIVKVDLSHTLHR